MAIHVARLATRKDETFHYPFRISPLKGLHASSLIRFCMVLRTFPLLLDLHTTQHNTYAEHTRERDMAECGTEYKDHGFQCSPGLLFFGV